mmetsp:Transcript_3518/g.10219  ORF Transcript_3518/g.10219 Transcript_3518/m.10219 type:complete len:508 (+) Transcript_3518:246-1769(+)
MFGAAMGESGRFALAAGAVVAASNIIGAAALEATADGSLLDSEGQPLVFVHRKLLERKLQSYASDHALAISLGTILSFMAIKVAMCGCWLGRRAWRDHKRQMMDDCMDNQGPTDWEIDMSDIKIVKRKNGEDWELGSGNFGKVMRGIRGDVQPVAIKSTFKRDRQMEDAFIREIAMMKYVSRDRNIVQFYGACVQTNNLLLVAELMEGGDLRNALNVDGHTKLGWYGRGKSICVDMARGLAFLHANKVIHRDLKSKNVLLTKDGVAKIGDVGMAKIMSDGYLTRDGALGTMAWAAPELLLGEKCSEKVDIYSLGICIWEVVTQDVPMRGALRDPVVPTECPQEVADLITACRQRDQHLRPSAKDIVRMLYHADPAWEEPPEVRAMLQSGESDSEPLYEDEDMTAAVLTMTLEDSATMTATNNMKLEDGHEKPQLQNVVLEIKAKLEATRSSVASVPSTNATFAPVQRPETGQFARLPASDEMDSQMSAASYGTADLHNSSNDRTMSP